MPTLTLRQGDKFTTVAFTGTPALAELLRAQGVPFATPCGGKGLCGKCRVEADGALSPSTAEETALGTRLACRTRLLGDAAVTLPAPRALQNIAASGLRPAFALDPLPSRYGLAVDIGTTTLAASLVSLPTGEVLASAAAENPQRAVAADVLGRIEAAMHGQAVMLQAQVWAAIDRLRAELMASLPSPVSVPDQAVVTGNTAMLYLLTKRDPEPLSHAPFTADHLFGHAVALPGFTAYAPRCMGAYVGADITCALLASQLCSRHETALLADVGTNGEVALWHRGVLRVCSTAAGPAFEGAGLACGCGSVEGAIDRVWVEDGRLACSTIGGAPAVGLCGSGALDALAALLALGRLDETGRLPEGRACLAGDVYLSQQDVRNLQLAKGAVAAGIVTLCQSAGVAPGDVEALYLAGGFGRHIDLQNAAAIGLFPLALTHKAHVIGNAALAGAEMLLLHAPYAQQSEALARKAQVVALGGNPAFSDNYADCMLLEPI